MLLKNARWAIRIQFSLGAVLLGLWAVRIAEFKTLVGLTNSELALYLLIPPFTLMAVMTQTPKITRKFGVRNLILIGLILWSFSFFALSAIPPRWVIALILVIMGMGAAVLEVGLNAVAQKIDRDDRPVMLSAHGFWSIGFTIGSVLSGLLAENQIPFLTQQILVTPIILILAWMCYLPLPEPRASSAEQKSSWPSLAFLPFCLIPFAALLIEGAMGDWASVFLKEERGANPMQFGLITGSFTAGMALTRITGDYLRRFLSARILLIISIFAMALGLVGFALLNALWFVGLGAVICGLGAGMIYPLVILLANEGRSEEDASGIIASIASVSFLAFLVAPPFMGFIADLWSLSTAFALLIPIAVSSYLWLWLSRRA